MPDSLQNTDLCDQARNGLRLFNRFTAVEVVFIGSASSSGNQNFINGPSNATMAADT